MGKKDDSEGSRKGFKLLTEEIQVLAKKAVKRLNGVVGRLDKRLAWVGFNRLRTKCHHPGIGHHQDNQQAGDMRWKANTTFIRMPTATFEVTEGLFLPVAARILIPVSCGALVTSAQGSS